MVTTTNQRAIKQVFHFSIILLLYVITILFIINIVSHKMTYQNTILEDPTLSDHASSQVYSAFGHSPLKPSAALARYRPPLSYPLSQTDLSLGG